MQGSCLLLLLLKIKIKTSTLDSQPRGSGVSYLVQRSHIVETYTNPTEIYI